MRPSGFFRSKTLRKSKLKRNAKLAREADVSLVNPSARAPRPAAESPDRLRGLGRDRVGDELARDPDLVDEAERGGGRAGSG